MPCATAAGDFLVERGFQPSGRDARMALRIGGDTDPLDTGFAQAALLDHRQRIGERTGGIDVAADHQQTPHIGLGTQGLERSDS